MSEPLQHSPGPFTYLKRDRYIRDAEGNLIADVFESPHDGDGQIFAAAPDMLRLLRVLVGIDNGGHEFPDNCFAWRDAMMQAEALITRLDGGE